MPICGPNGCDVEPLPTNTGLGLNLLITETLMNDSLKPAKTDNKVFEPGFHAVDDMPEFEEFDADDWKVLFMLLCENRSGLDLEKGLTDHGKQLLKNVKRKIGINAVGVDIDANSD